MTIINPGKKSSSDPEATAPHSEAGLIACRPSMDTVNHGKSKLKRVAAHLLPTAFALTGALSYAAYSQANPAAIAEAIGTGVKTFGEAVSVYNQINPAQSGYTTVINSSNNFVTVRSYNNNDWAMLVAAGQLNLKPGAQGMITAKTDPIKLVWRRGNYGTTQAFGTQNLSQSTAPKGAKYVFVIGQQNTN